MAVTYEFLNTEREAPSVVTLPNAVQWSIFRKRSDAEHHADQVQLGTGHELIGGHGHDSVGDYWWVGVRVESVSKWGGRQAINKRGRFGDS